MDRVDRATRSRNMAAIRSRDTRPELTLRSALHRLGFRFRVHDRKLPGKPDLVLPKHRVAIFVHGCFWHRHPGCRFATMPASNTHTWAAKFAATELRDHLQLSALENKGWRVAVVWECALRPADLSTSLARLAQWIQTDEAQTEIEAPERNGAAARRGAASTIYG